MPVRADAQGLGFRTGTGITGDNGFVRDNRSLDRDTEGDWSGESALDAAGENGSHREQVATRDPRDRGTRGADDLNRGQDTKRSAADHRLRHRRACAQLERGRAGSGRIVQLHPRFVRGGPIRAGQQIALIGPEAFGLAVAQAKANVRNGVAHLAELDANAEATRAIEREALDLAEREASRQRQLAERGWLAASAVETQQRAVLGQRLAVQSLENQLTFLPPQRDALERTRAVSRLSLDQARLDLDRTQVVAPFDGRVATAVLPDLCTP